MKNLAGQCHYLSSVVLKPQQHIGSVNCSLLVELQLYNYFDHRICYSEFLRCLVSYQHASVTLEEEIGLSERVTCMLECMFVFKRMLGL